MNYEQRLRAIGRLIDRSDLRDVCVMETADGVVVSGIAPLDFRTGIAAFAPRSMSFSNERIQEIESRLGKRSNSLFRRG